MKKALLLATMLSTTVSFSAIADVKKVDIPSGNGLQGYQDIIAGKQPTPFTITGQLFTPGECTADKKLPAVIVQHGSGMPTKEWYTTLPKELNKAGIVALVPDGHTPRGITGTGKNQARLSKADRIYDTFSAFNYLETVPCVDIDRVGVTGYSFGGIIAMDSVETVLAEKLGKGKVYKASMPVYPSCQATFGNTKSTNTVVRVLVGEKDDYTPAKYCLDSVKVKQTKGWNIDVTVLKGAHHGFISTKGAKPAKSWTFGDCGPLNIDDKGYETSVKHGFSTKDGWKNFIKKAVKTCARKGVTVGGTKETSQTTLNYTVKFFMETL